MLSGYVEGFRYPRSIRCSAGTSSTAAIEGADSAQCIPPPCVGSLACASATGLQQDICACVSVPVSMWPQKVCRLDDSLLPRRLLPAGLWRAGEEGQALLLPLPALAAAQALLLLPLCQCPAHGVWRNLGKHVEAPRHGFISQYLLPQSLGPAWMLWLGE